MEVDLEQSVACPDEFLSMVCQLCTVKHLNLVVTLILVILVEEKKVPN